MSTTTNVLIAPLVKLWFRKRAGHIYTIELTTAVIGLLGLNKACFRPLERRMM